MSSGVQAWLDGESLQADWQFDRGLHYGDGLFETMWLRAGRLRFADLHAARLAEGCRRLQIGCDARAVLQQAQALLGPGDAMVKLLVTRGIATARGYAPSGSEQARTMLLRYEAPPAELPQAPETHATLLSLQLGENPLLAGLKHLNRLELVMARAQMQGSSAFEGILCSSSGWLACGTMSNLFLVKDDRLLTPRVDRCGIAGVTRAVVLREAAIVGLPVQECDLAPAQLLQADELFFTNVRWGVRPVTHIDGRALAAPVLGARLRARVAALDA